MNDRTDDFIIINLDRDRILRLSYLAIKFYKKSFGKCLSKVGENFDMEEVAKIMYVALRHEDKELTLEKVEELIDTKPFKYCMDKVTELLNITFGVENVDSKNIQALAATEPATT